MTAVLAEMLARPTLPGDLDYLHEELSKEKILREKFLDEVDPSTKAEFINGTVIVHSPATLQHLLISSRLVEALQSHVSTAKLGYVFVEMALCTFPRNDYEPDICFFTTAKLIGLKRTTVRLPVPDFIVEILSPSTKRNDRGVKMQDYEAHGVGEYWIVDPETERLEQYTRAADGAGFAAVNILNRGDVVRSTAVAGFTMPINDIFEEPPCGL